MTTVQTPPPPPPSAAVTAIENKIAQQQDSDKLMQQATGWANQFMLEAKNIGSGVPNGTPLTNPQEWLDYAKSIGAGDDEIAQMTQAQGWYNTATAEDTGETVAQLQQDLTTEQDHEDDQAVVSQANAVLASAARAAAAEVPALSSLSFTEQIRAVFAAYYTNSSEDGQSNLSVATDNAQKAKQITDLMNDLRSKEPKDASGTAEVSTTEVSQLEQLGVKMPTGTTKSDEPDVVVYSYQDFSDAIANCQATLDSNNTISTQSTQELTAIQGNMQLALEEQSTAVKDDQDTAKTLIQNAVV
jgi:hypothetical protein